MKIRKVGLCIVAIAIWFSGVSRSVNAADSTNSPSLMSDGLRVVFYRNYKNPDDPRYKLLPAKYRLGKASVVPPSEAWIKLGHKIGIREDITEFPLVFAQKRRSADGKELLVVAQLAHRFSGDGYSERGPEIWMRFTAIDMTDVESPMQISSSETDLGQMQNACVHVGEPDKEEPSRFEVTFETEQTGSTNNFVSKLKAQLQNDGKVKAKVE